MINIIIFSKDRASQLDMFLRSMECYFKEYSDNKISILYTYSNDFFKKGYDILLEKYPEINFLLEKSFKKDMLSLIVEENKYSVFFVDDIIWKSNFTVYCNDFATFEKDIDILTFSLRLHPNLTYCYTANINMIPLKNNIWKWEKCLGDYCYPMSLDGHFFRTKEIFTLLKNLNYKNPNQLEAQMACNPLQNQKMICCEKSSIFNNPCNKVQTNNYNKHGNITANYINQEFLKGKLLDFKIYENLDNESCHKEMPIVFI